MRRSACGPRSCWWLRFLQGLGLGAGGGEPAAGGGSGRTSPRHCGALHQRQPDHGPEPGHHPAPGVRGAASVPRRHRRGRPGDGGPRPGRRVEPFRMSASDYRDALGEASAAGVQLPRDPAPAPPTPWDPPWPSRSTSTAPSFMRSVSWTLSSPPTRPAVARRASACPAGGAPRSPSSVRNRARSTAPAAFACETHRPRGAPDPGRHRILKGPRAGRALGKGTGVGSPGLTQPAIAIRVRM